MIITIERPLKRKLFTLMALLPWIGGCAVSARQAGATDGAQQRFKGIGMVLVVDAVPGEEMKGVVFYDDQGAQIYAKSLVSRRTREIMGLGGIRVPLTVRAEWGEDRRFSYSKTPTWTAESFVAITPLP